MKKNKSGESQYASAAKKAKALGFDLGKVIKHRKTLVKGSQEYNIAQNQINQAYGVSKRHTVAGVQRSEPMKMAKAQKSLKQKLPKTTGLLSGLAKSLGAEKKKKTKKYAGGM